jgi:hypothetical protein
MTCRRASEGVPEGGEEIKKIMLLALVLLLPSLMITIIPGRTGESERLPQKRRADTTAVSKGTVRRGDAGIDAGTLMRQAANSDTAGKIKEKKGKRAGPTKKKPDPGRYQSTGRQCYGNGFLKSMLNEEKQS